jgi:hypothetical protein
MRVLPMAYIEHQIPGRMRLRVPERRGDVGFFQSIVGTRRLHFPANADVTSGRRPFSSRVSISGSFFCEGVSPKKSLIKIGEPSHTRTHEEICL